MTIWFNYLDGFNRIRGRINGITGEIEWGIDKDGNEVKVERNELIKKYKIENNRLVSKE